MIFAFGILLLIAFLVIFIKYKDHKLLKTVTNSNRGTKTERNLVLKLLKSGISEQTIFHDLYVKRYYGFYSQIDLVVATKVGIIVFEVKNYKGWIFGSGFNTNWTQVLAYGKKKYRFYNPILQNNKHIDDLKRQLNQFYHIPFYSVVVFYGDCVFKEVDFIPNGTFLVKSNRVLEVFNKIIFENEPANYSNKKDVVRVLKEAVKNGDNKEIQDRHVKNIKDMLGKDRIFN